MNSIIEEKESLLRVNEDLNKKLQELGTKLANTNDEMKKTKEDLELAKNTIKRYKEENVNLEDRLSEYNREQHIHQTDVISSRYILQLNISCFISSPIYYVYFTD